VGVGALADLCTLK